VEKYEQILKITYEILYCIQIFVAKYLNRRNHQLRFMMFSVLFLYRDKNVVFVCHINFSIPAQDYTECGSHV
jgi:hypothetical protein